MAKRKAVTPEPPKSVGHLLCLECMSRITPEDVQVYAAGVFATPQQRKKETAAQRKAFCEALMKFSELGWAVYHESKASKDVR